jgi:hypothetical protein
VISMFNSKQCAKCKNRITGDETDQ